MSCTVNPNATPLWPSTPVEDMLAVPSAAGEPGSGGAGPTGRLMEFAGALVRAVEARDPYTRCHAEHVAFYAERLAEHLQLPISTRQSIRLAALLHDVGKIAVPRSVLTKPGPLSSVELAFIRQHPSTGGDILEQTSPMSIEAALVRQHHERWDGSGYPDGLCGEAISVGARIINVADSMDAMLMHRTYKHTLTVEQMLDELQRCAGTQFDPVLAAAAAQWCRDNASKLFLPDNAARAASA